MPKNVELTKKQYTKWLSLIVRGIYLAEPKEIELAAGMSMTIYLKCTFDLPEETEPVIKYLCLDNFDGINYTFGVMNSEATEETWNAVIKNTEEVTDGGEEGTGSTAGASD